VIDLRAGTSIWLAAGITDMRRGFHGLSAQVQTVLEQEPYSGHVFVFRRRRGDLIKLLRFDVTAFVFSRSGRETFLGRGFQNLSGPRSHRIDLCLREAEIEGARLLGLLGQNPKAIS
jgi:hypothetical protein